MANIPDLVIQCARLPKSSYACNLQRFLYVGGASSDARWGIDAINSGKFGQPRLERLTLLLSIKEQLEMELNAGKSYKSFTGTLSRVKHFFQFVDKYETQCSLDQLESIYLHYAEYLFRKVHIKPPRLSPTTAYGYANLLSRLFGRILDIPYATTLITRTRLKYPRQAKKSLSRTAEKQSLEDTFRLGVFLVDLVNGLSTDSILGELPLRIPIRNGLIENNEIQLNYPADEWLSGPKEKWTSVQKDSYRQIIKTRQPVQSIDKTKRWTLVNLRVTAEFLIFIAQTGINMTQAKYLRSEQFKYKSAGDSWEVRSYKSRRGGEVLFRIYKSYKPFLHNYISFINYFFPNSQWLFPIVSNNGKDFGRKPIYRYWILQKIITNSGIPWIPPKALRNTRINWLLRRSGDEELTAEMAQHTKEVLRQYYERPSQQRAMVEITRFWNKHDPIMQGDLVGSIIAGQCDGRPEAVDTKPTTVINPNCTNPSGCLWCKHLRDIDSEDYVWSLVSLRHLKSIEASGTVTRESLPADFATNRLSEKIKWFRNSNKTRAKWVMESEMRIEEGFYHPNWSNIIEFLE